MARMIPSTIHPSVPSEAERRLFKIIKDAPGTEHWVCLHSLGLARHPTKRRGEIDFLILSRKGIFILEVKGGGVARKDGIWQTTNRYGEIIQLKESPFDQAAKAMFALEDNIRHQFKGDPRLTKLLYGYGVMFPDVPFDKIGVEGDQRQIYDAHDRDKPFIEYIDRLAVFARESSKFDCYVPTEKDIEILNDFLRPDFDLVPSLSIQADTVSEQLLVLEKEQYEVLDILDLYPRLLIQGSAGTGKTLLAIESAKREARLADGNILLICFNRLLAKFLAAKIKEENHSGRIVVKSIYGLMKDLIEASPFATEFATKRKASDSKTLFDELYPEYTMRALLETEVNPYKTLIIDEAQDIMSQEYLDLLDAYTQQGLKAGRWRIFCDVNNQAAVFGSFEQTVLDKLMCYGHSMILPTNRRNTRSIAEETSMLAQPKVVSLAKVNGSPVKYICYSKSVIQTRKLTRILTDLLNDNIAPARITILSPLEVKQSCAATLIGINVTHLTNENIEEFVSGKLSSITYCSISAFKGLENDFIILTDIQDLNSEWWKSVIYVGMSRARTALFFLMNESIRDSFNDRLRVWIMNKPEYKYE